MTVKRPALRWHGGKWRLAPWIIANMPAHRIYVEPFGGGGSVLLRKERSYAEVYNDLDGEAVNFFRAVRDNGRVLREKLFNTPFARDDFDEAYELAEDPIERARRMAVRSFMGFGSNSHTRVTGFRANSNRSGTTPAHDWANYAEAMPALVERLRGIVIENKDAKAVMAQHDGPQTLHYVDPPYVFATRSDLSKDYAHELSDAQHDELLIFLKGLQGSVILSGYRSTLYDEALMSWKRLDRVAFADGAKKRVECLWLNAKALESNGIFQAGEAA